MLVLDPILLPALSILHRLLWVIVVVCIDFGIDSSTRYFNRHFNRLGNQLDIRFDIDCYFTAYGVDTWFLLGFNPYRSTSQYSSSVDAVGFTASTSRYFSRSFTCQLSLPSTRSMRSVSCRWGFLLRDALLLLLPPAKTLLAFLLPLIQPSFFVVLVTLASYPYPYPYCSCSCITLVAVDIVTLLVLWVDIQEGFSIRVALGTKCTQYLFCGHHFFRENTAASPLLRLLLDAAASIDSTLLIAISFRLCYCLLSCI